MGLSAPPPPRSQALLELAPREPVPLEVQHVVNRFYSGQAAVDRWLHHQAGPAQLNNRARTWVCISEGQVMGYYSLRLGEVFPLADGFRHLSPKRPEPRPIPVLLLHRLGVDVQRRGCRWARAMLRHAIYAAHSVTPLMALEALVAAAPWPHAQAFYQRYGFQPSGLAPHLWALPLGPRSPITGLLWGRGRGRGTDPSPSPSPSQGL